MFGFPRLAELVKVHGNDAPLIKFLLQQLASFTGEKWEQEDDVTLVTLQRADGYGHSMITNASATPSDETNDERSGDEHGWRTLDTWTIASEAGNERQAIERLVEAVRELHFPAQRLEDLKTAVGEATMNAMEHGNHFEADLPVTIEVLSSRTSVTVRITDEGGSFSLNQTLAPDLDAKLAGLQSPRGWGLFLIERLVDEVRVTGDNERHTIELTVHRSSE